MARGSYEDFPMIVDGVTIGLITTTLDVIERFNIPEAVINLEVPGVNRSRKAHERRVYSNSNSTTSTINTNVEKVVKVYTPDKNRVNSGKKIRVPTGLRSIPVSLTGTAATAENAGSARLATFNFPHRASNYQIARWLTVNIPEARRPNYFVTPSGARRRVSVAAAPGQTTGEGTEDDTTP